MDRPKALPVKKGKGRAQATPPGELIALGKSTAQDKPDQKRPSSPQPIVRKLIVSGIKRDIPSQLEGASSLLTKKPKVGGAQAYTPLGRPAIDPMERRGSPAPTVPVSVTQPQLMAFEEAAIEVDPSDLVWRAQAASKEGDEEQVEGLICGAVRHLRNNRCKPDPRVYLSMLYLAKTQPSFFLSDIVTEAFCSILKRDVAHNFKAKGNPLVSVLSCNMLMAAFVREENWPDNFVKVYIDDLLGERVWVDREDCRPFVDNILTAFPTTQSPRHLLVNTDNNALTVGLASPMRSLMEEDEACKSSDGADSDRNYKGIGAASEFPVFPRFPCQQTNIQTYVLEVVKDHIAKRQAMDVSNRSIIRLMAVSAGYSEIRTMAAQRLEMWLQNPKLQKSAQDLLLSVCCNCCVDTKADQEVILQLLKMRIKIKQNVSHYLMCFRQLLHQHTDSVALVVKTTLINELSSTRNHNNMALLNLCFSHDPHISSKVLAEVFQDLLASKDDYLRSLRFLLRETVRNTRQDINFVTFCQTLTCERLEPKFVDLEPALKERYVMGVVDLIPLSMLLSITPGVKDATSRTDPKEREMLYKFRNQLAVMERDAVYWLHSVVPKIMEVNSKPKEYIHCLRKVMFMELPEFYYNKDNWPPENERNFMLRLVVEAPVLEDTLLRVILIGLARDLPAQSHDCIDIVDSRVRRAAGLHLDNMEVLQMSSLEIINALMNISTYRHPENIVLPTGYTPPKLAITSTYWKSWIVLLLLAAFNPTTIGKEAWENYPTLKCLMEMMMTNNYSFPPPTYATDEQSVEDMRNAEKQLIEEEIPKILEFESHLAGNPITQQTSLLLLQLMTLDPHGIPRSPPPGVGDTFSQLNTTYKIGHLLCRSRQPDFLLDIIERQGPSRSMSWLAELVETSEGSLSVLPVHCLCEFLLHDPQPLNLTDLGHDDVASKAERQRLKMRTLKHGQLVRQLQELMHSSPDTTSTMFDVLSYFLQRLASNLASARKQAIKGLSMVIKHPSKSSEEEAMMQTEMDGRQSQKTGHDWLLKYIPGLPMFPLVKGQLCNSIRQACQVETDPQLVNSYITFLSQYAVDHNMHILDDVALDVSQLIVERSSVMSYILPDIESKQGEDYDLSLHAFLLIFHSYISTVRRLQKGEYSWSNTQNQILLQWKTGETATMHILIVHAIIIVISYGMPRLPSSQGMYTDLLDLWFPLKDSMPKAFLLDTSEEALLLPDWLKLRMIRSSEPRLVDAALSELDPRQSLLFMQSFGIPVSSMTHLLMCLDTATENDPVNLLQIVQAMNDPTYISRLIHIQRMRGAQGGDKFYSLVTEGGTMPVVCPEETKMSGDGASVSTFCVRPQIPAHTPLTVTSLISDFFKLLNAENGAQEAIKMQFQLIKMLEGSEASEVLQQMMRQPARTCPVFTVLINRHPSLHSALVPLLQTILDRAALDPSSSSSSTSLLAVIGQFLKSQKQQRPVSRKCQTSLDLHNFRTQGAVTTPAFIQGVQEMENSRLEGVMQHLMQKYVQQQGTAAEGIHLACSILHQSSDTEALSFARESLLVDWLEKLDPEIVSVDVDLEEAVVFGERVEGRKGQWKMSYLLAQLAYNSSWDTLTRCLRSVLTPQKLHRLDPTSVLDFLWACRHNPRIWQGRKQKTTENALNEDIFDFSKEQLLVVVDFILLEAEQKHMLPGPQASCNTDPASDATLSSVGEEAGESKEVSDRLELLLTCLCNRKHRVMAVAAHLQHREEEECCLQLLMELYLHFPCILTCVPSLSSACTSDVKIHSRLDTVAHRLIGMLARVVSGKVAETRLKDANMVCRKLAASHPNLILRQLPLLAAVVEGHSQVSIGEISHHNLLQLFINVMGLMELLQPLIFNRQHTALLPLLHAFFTVLTAYRTVHRQLVSLASKLVAFLQNFVTNDPEYASSILQQHVQQLSKMSSLYSNMTDLKSLLTGLTLPSEDEEDNFDIIEPKESDSDSDESPETVEAESGSMVELPSESAEFVPSMQLLQSMACRLQPPSSLEDLKSVLKDLDETSQKKVTILDTFWTDLKDLMTHVDEYCRNTAFVLIIRYINHCPSNASQFLSSYLNCLEHSNPEVVISALKNLADFTVLCPDDSSILLQKAFEVDIRSSLNAAPYITSALQLLNLENILCAGQTTTQT